MAAITSARTGRIRELNDQLRQRGIGGRVVTTAGLFALGPDCLAHVHRAVIAFDGFTAGNDPHGEHDFGRVDVAGYAVLFKIDYYDIKLTCQSRNPADPQVTCRVMTLMLAEEF